MSPQPAGATATPDEVEQAAQPPDSRFPAWLVDTVIATAVAEALLAGLAIAVRPGELVEAALAWTRRVFIGSNPTRADVADWLTSQERARPTIAPRIGLAFDQAYTSGYLVGTETAQMILRRERITGQSVRAGAGFPRPRWSFTPHNLASARRRAGVLGLDGEIENLWQNSRPLMRDATRGRIDAISKVLADGIARGASSGRIAGELRDVIDSSRWAHQVAVTEVNRAVSYATLTGYRAAGIERKEWLNAHDQRVCKEICRPNGDAGPVALDAEFPSGDVHPPGHPSCRCGLIPFWTSNSVR